MPMLFPYLKSARIRLQERKNTCLRAQFTNADQHVRHFLAFLAGDPVFKPIHHELHLIAAQKFQSVDDWIDGNHRCIKLPDEEMDRAAFYLRLLELFADPRDDVGIPHFHGLFAIGSNKFQDRVDEFFQQILLPLFGYFDERVDTSDLMLYLLARYQRECSWFLSEQIAKLYSDADSKKKEEVVDLHLREWLFREGIDYPFSTPRSPSGRADIVVLNEEEPLPLEVKVYDGANRDTSHVRQGMWQAFRYAMDYGKSFGYLIVFNASHDSLVFSGNLSGAEKPPAVAVGDRIVFPTVVPIVPPLDTASKEKPSKVVTIAAPNDQ